MKQITEILDEIAHKYHHENYEMLICGVEDFGLERITSALTEAAEIYANQSKWISTSESLPEKSCQVLGIMKDTLDQYICFYKKSRNVFLVYGAGVDPISDMKVTHWQPLPTSPPKPDLTDQ